MTEGIAWRPLGRTRSTEVDWRPRQVPSLERAVVDTLQTHNRLGPWRLPSMSQAAGPTSWTAPENLAFEPLPGSLDTVPEVNSNHPEILLGTGIALSTMPGSPDRHLDFDLQGPFGFFSAHQNGSTDRMVQAIVLANPGSEAVSVAIGRSAAYTTREAPFRDRGENTMLDPARTYTSGPGDATASAILRGQGSLVNGPIRLAPGEVRVLWQRPLDPGVASMVQLQLRSDGPVHMAELFGPREFDTDSATRMWLDGQRVPPDPRDRPPTPPGATGGVLIYGRVAGVQRGETWKGTIVTPGKTAIELDDRPVVRAFAVDTALAKTLGTGQVQSAPLVRRYADSAYASHGNYGVTYELELPLAHRGQYPVDCALFFDSPGKVGTGPSRVFRGEVEVSEAGQTRRFHISQKSGEMGNVPIFQTRMEPGEARRVKVRLVIPADITPAQALRLQSRPAAEVNRLRPRSESPRGW